jgi:hypothetical protein
LNLKKNPNHVEKGEGKEEEDGTKLSSYPLTSLCYHAMKNKLIFKLEKKLNESS